MHPFKTIRLIWTFYKSFLFASLLVTAICLYFFWNYGFSVFFGIFWLKIATLALIYYYINDYKKKQYYYYYNLGISKVFLWVTTMLFDLVLFNFLILQASKFR